jgi:tryptophan halogenase
MHDRLRAKLDFWRQKPVATPDFEDQFLPGQPDSPLTSGGIPGDHRTPIDTGKLFTRSSYEAVMYGMDFMSEECRERYGEDRPPAAVHRRIVERLAAAPQKLPPHHVWLQRVLGMPAYRNS